MDLYLMQHGEARPEQDDPSRPLTERGREDVERVARAAARFGLRITAIRHSAKLRAQQTAEILAQRLLPPPELAATTGLAPNDDPTPCAHAVEEAEGWQLRWILTPELLPSLDLS